jgi:hypothetical protein
MEKHDSESGHSTAEKDIGHIHHTEDALEKFPDPDAGLSDEEKAAIVSSQRLSPAVETHNPRRTSDWCAIWTSKSYHGLR